ncbi:MAG: hypothetical protein G01um101416_626 [Microgenomates group bacterium Gr01-1014_16]|nr:MAG: hypothetical protein G01um101416_626 [Microgenomates group bacterium Gr01-1014_16]
MWFTKVVKDNNFFLLFLLLVTAAVASVYIYLHKAKTINAQMGEQVEVGINGL